MKKEKQKQNQIDIYLINCSGNKFVNLCVDE